MVPTDDTYGTYVYLYYEIYYYIMLCVDVK